MGDVYGGGDLAFESAWRYAVLGNDPASAGDDIQVVTNSYGWSEEDNDGWDDSSRLVDYYVRTFSPSSLFLFATGNGGPGYGTITPPRPAVSLDVAASSQYGSADRHSITDTTQITYGDIIPFSNRGPGAFGQSGPNLAADGAYGWGAVPLNAYYDHAEFELGLGTGAEANEPWVGTSRSAPVAAGAMALTYQAFKARVGRWPTWEEGHALAMGGARFAGYDTWTMGAGVLDAGDSVRLAAGIDGLYSLPAEWAAGDYLGKSYTAFPNFVAPGRAATARLAITNPSARPVQATLKAQTLRKVGEDAASLLLEPTWESPQSELFPSYVVRLDRAKIPAGTDLLAVRAALPLDQSDPDGDDMPLLDEVLNIGLLQHTDVDRDGSLFHDADGNGAVGYEVDGDDVVDWSKTELDRWEFELMSQHFASTNSWEVSVHHPAERWKDGLYLAVWHGICEAGNCTGRGAGQSVRLPYRLEYYRYESWPWLEAQPATLTVAAGSATTLTATLTVPAGAAPGQYGGTILVDYDRAPTDHRIVTGGGFEPEARRLVIPVSVNVPATLGERPITLAGAAADDPAAPYNNGRLRGLLDRTWREETGDCAPVLRPGHRRGGGDSTGRQLMVAQTTWSERLAAAADVDTSLWAPSPDAFSDPAVRDERGPLADPTWFGPFTLKQIGKSADALGQQGTWGFDTTSGGNEDWVAGPAERGELLGVIAHSVRFGGSEVSLPFTMTVSTLTVSPWPLRLAADGCALVTVRSQAALKDLAATALGLSEPSLETNVRLANDATVERALRLTTPAAGFTVVITGQEGTDVDLAVFYDGDGDGSYDETEQIAMSDSPTEREAVRRPGLSPAGNYLIRVIPFSVPTLGSRFDLYIDYIAGKDLSVQRAPVDVAAGQPATINVCAKNLPRPGPLAGALVFGPGAAPGLTHRAGRLDEGRDHPDAPRSADRYRHQASAHAKVDGDAGPGRARQDALLAIPPTRGALVGRDMLHNLVVNAADSACFGLALGLASFTTVSPLFVQWLGATPLWVGLVAILHPFGWHLTQLATARYVAGLPRYLPSVMVLTAAERAPFFALAAVAAVSAAWPKALVLAVVMILLFGIGLGGGLTATAYQALVGRIMPPNRVGAFYGLKTAAANGAFAVGAVIAGQILPERKIDHRPCSREKYAPAPERRANRKSPLRAAKSRIELPDLKQAHRILVAIRHDGETETVAEHALLVRFRDEPSESFHGAGQWRHELGDLFGGQHRQQRRGIAIADLSERNLVAANRGEAKLPVERNRSALDVQSILRGYFFHTPSSGAITLPRRPERRSALITTMVSEC